MADDSESDNTRMVKLVRLVVRSGAIGGGVVNNRRIFHVPAALCWDEAGVVPLCPSGRPACIRDPPK
jgi:hypothetical protein